MTERRYLVVNADDFGRSPGVNRGIALAHERGILTSASLMVRWPAAAGAAAYARGRPALGVGLHVDVGEWRHAGEGWEPVYEVVAPEDARGLEREVGRQLDAFRALLGRDPTHLDSHQHVHRTEPARSVFLAAARRLRVPLRDATPGIRSVGDFYGQTAEGEPIAGATSADALLAVLASVRPGITELVCHPGLAEDDLDSPYLGERASELEALCDPRVRAALGEGEIQLCSFADPVVVGPLRGAV